MVAVRSIAYIMVRVRLTLAGCLTRERAAIGRVDSGLPDTKHSGTPIFPHDFSSQPPGAALNTPQPPQHSLGLGPVALGPWPKPRG